MNCQHTATDVHGAKMTCTAEGTMEVRTDDSARWNHAEGYASRIERYCPDHVEIYDETKRPGVPRGKRHLLIDLDLDRLKEFGSVQKDTGSVHDLLAETLENFARTGGPGWKHVWTTNAAHVGIARLVKEA
jgi:hypothetical protein